MVVQNLFNYPGSKSYLLPELARLYGGYRDSRYVDLFAGGASVPLGLRPARALINDKNQTLIKLYETIKNKMTFNLWPDLSKSEYLELRQVFNLLTENGYGDSVISAVAYYYLIRGAFNGLVRYNQKGGYNVPYGGTRKIPEIDFQEFQKTTENWEFMGVDFGEIQLEESDFVYADPPYAEGFNSYLPGGFNMEDQERLASYLSRHTGPVVASNSNTDSIRDLYESQGFKANTIQVPRKISGKRQIATELLMTKNI